MDDNGYLRGQLSYYTLPGKVSIPYAEYALEGTYSKFSGDIRFHSLGAINPSIASQALRPLSDFISTIGHNQQQISFRIINGNCDSISVKKWRLD